LAKITTIHALKRKNEEKDYSVESLLEELGIVNIRTKPTQFANSGSVVGTLSFDLCGGAVPVSNQNIVHLQARENDPEKICVGGVWYRKGTRVPLDNPQPMRDKDGNKIQAEDSNGNKLFYENGSPIWKTPKSKVQINVENLQAIDAKIYNRAEDGWGYDPVSGRHIDPKECQADTPKLSDFLSISKAPQVEKKEDTQVPD